MHAIRQLTTRMEREGIRTHWLALAEDTKHQEGLEQEENDNEQERHQLVEGVECVGLVCLT